MPFSYFWGRGVDLQSLPIILVKVNSAVSYLPSFSRFPLSKKLAEKAVETFSASITYDNDDHVTFFQMEVCRYFSTIAIVYTYSRFTFLTVDTVQYFKNNNSKQEVIVHVSLIRYNMICAINHQVRSHIIHFRAPQWRINIHSINPALQWRTTSTRRLNVTIHLSKLSLFLTRSGNHTHFPWRCQPFSSIRRDGFRTRSIKVFLHVLHSMILSWWYVFCFDKISKRYYLLMLPWMDVDTKIIQWPIIDECKADKVLHFLNQCVLHCSRANTYFYLLHINLSKSWNDFQFFCS